MSNRHLYLYPFYRVNENQYTCAWESVPFTLSGAPRMFLYENPQESQPLSLDKHSLYP